jgi:hypothetical protein
MFFPRYFFLLSTLMIVGLSEGAYASPHLHGFVTKADSSLRGTWYSTEGAITFKANGTVHYHGKRYFYAVSNGGLIQLSGKHRSNAIPYQLAGGKLTLMENGEEVVYTHQRPRRK